MSQGRFSKEEAQACVIALQEIMTALPRKKSMEFLGHFNDLFLFLAAAKVAAPHEIGHVLQTELINNERE